MIRWIIVSFLCVFVMNACTIEKRLYNRGFHVDWHRKLPVQSSDAERKSFSENKNKFEYEKHAQIDVNRNTNPKTDTVEEVIQTSITPVLLHEKHKLTSTEKHSSNQNIARKISRIRYSKAIQNDPEKDEKASTFAAVFTLILGLAALTLAIVLLYTYTIETSIVISLFLIFSSLFLFVLAPVLLAIGVLFLMDRNYIRKHEKELKQRTINNNSLRKKQLEQGDTSSIYARLIMGILIIGLFVALFFYTTFPLLLLFALLGLCLVVWSALDWVKIRKLRVAE